jgi:hypothetical protein
MEEIQGTLRLQGRDWTVKIVDPAEIDGDHGQAEFTTLTIKLSADLDIKASLLHEILEVINFYFELKLPHWKIKALESGLTQALGDNKITIHKE